MDDNYLVHHGIKGMKWGVRRNRTVSTSGTPGGHKTAKTAEDYKRMKKNVDTANTYVESGKKVKAKAARKKTEAKTKEELRNMSDKELQQVVNRLNMEERYSQVMNSRATATGKDRVTQILDGAGTALAIGSSALSIMIAIKELQK